MLQTYDTVTDFRLNSSNVKVRMKTTDQTNKELVQ